MNPLMLDRHQQGPKGMLGVNGQFKINSLNHLLDRGLDPIAIVPNSRHFWPLNLANDGIQFRSSVRINPDFKQLLIVWVQPL